MHNYSSSDSASREGLEETVSRLQVQLEATSEELDQQKRVNLALVRRQVGMRSLLHHSEIVCLSRVFLVGISSTASS